MVLFRAEGGELHSLGGKFAGHDEDLSSIPQCPLGPVGLSARRIIKRMMDHGNQEDKKIGRSKQVSARAIDRSESGQLMQWTQGMVDNGHQEDTRKPA